MNETSGGSGGAGLDGGLAAGSMPGFGGGQPLLAQTLGLAMARRAADILGRHRDMHNRAVPDSGSPEAAQFALDDAIFTAVLDAANESLGQFDPRPPADRWCDALFQLLQLAHYAPRDG
jgi:hypothetical protein